jgi:hypothetical protein
MSQVLEDDVLGAEATLHFYEGLLAFVGLLIYSEIVVDLFGQLEIKYSQMYLDIE